MSAFFKADLYSVGTFASGTIVSIVFSSAAEISVLSTVVDVDCVAVVGASELPPAKQEPNTPMAATTTTATRQPFPFYFFLH